MDFVIFGAQKFELKSYAPPSTLSSSSAHAQNPLATSPSNQSLSCEALATDMAGVFV